MGLAHRGGGHAGRRVDDSDRRLRDRHEILSVDLVERVGPEDGFGQAFMVMDRVDGRPVLGDLSGTTALRSLPTLARRLPDMLAAAMADLHRLDPRPVMAGSAGDELRIPEMVSHLEAEATEFGRSDLVAVARWFVEHPHSDVPDVICHGDLHPLNMLIGSDGSVTVLDWSTSRLAPAAYDVAFTNLLLTVPPLKTNGVTRPLVRAIGRILARRFRRAYRRRSNTTVADDVLRWYEGIACFRALVEVAGWASTGDIDQHADHPWVVCGAALAARLERLTGLAVSPR